ncbi:helix-turn-helix domain-containing protein (plasmid) [Streptosporangium sp. CA-135522]
MARRAHQRGESFRSIGRRLGVAHTTISRLVNGVHWRNHSA